MRVIVILLPIASRAVIGGCVNSWLSHRYCVLVTFIIIRRGWPLEARVCNKLRFCFFQEATAEKRSTGEGQDSEGQGPVCGEMDRHANRSIHIHIHAGMQAGRPACLSSRFSLLAHHPVEQNQRLKNQKRVT